MVYNVIMHPQTDPLGWKHFTGEELTHSNLAIRHGIDNTPTEVEWVNLDRLVVLVLDPIREAVGDVLVISSGYRCATLNEKMGGDPESAHREGRAADLYCPGRSPEWLMGIITGGTCLPVDKVILEHGRWVHVQVARPGMRPRHERLRSTRNKSGRVVYTHWEPDQVGV